MIIDLSRNEKLQKYRIILSQHTSYLHKLLVYVLICLLLLRFFSEKFLNVCKPAQPGLLLVWKWHAYQADWREMVIVGWLRSMQSEIFLQMKFIIFQGVPTKQAAFLLGILLHIIRSLSSHFGSWDYPEKFGIYSQLDRKSKTCFFTFLNVYACWIIRDKSPNLTAFISKIQVFCRPESTDQSGTLWKWISTIFKIKNKYYKQLELKK